MNENRVWLVASELAAGVVRLLFTSTQPSNPQSTQGVLRARGMLERDLTIDFVPPLRVEQAQQLTGEDGRTAFAFDPPFETPPFVSVTLKFASAAGCTAHLVGEPTKSRCVVEVRSQTGVAPGVTVAIKAEI